MFEQATAVTIVGPLVFGLLLALLHRVKAELARQCQVTEDRLGNLLAALNVALIPMMLLAGLLTDRYGPRSIMLLGSFLTALSVGMLGTCTSYNKTLGIILMAGAGGSGLSVASTVLMNNGFFANNSAASQNMGNSFFCLGVLVTPMLCNLLIRAAGFRWASLILAFVCLAPGIVTGLTASAAFTLKDVQSPNLSILTENAILALTGGIFMLYVPIEWSLGISGMGPSYLQDCNLSEAAANRLQDVFWLLFLASRLAVGLSHYYGWMPVARGQTWLIVGLGLTAAVFMGNMLNSRGGSGVFGYLMVGFLLGPIFPTLVGVVLDLNKSHMGTAYGAMFSIGSLGNLALLPLMRMFAMRYDPHKAMGVPIVLAILLAAVALFFGLGWDQPAR